MWEKHREQQKKEEDSRETLKATAQFKSYWTREEVIGIEIYNSGKTRVSIKSVRLTVRGKAQPHSEELICTDHKGAGVYADGALQPASVIRTSVNLEPKDHVRFHVKSMRAVKPNELLQLPPDALKIVVESFANPEVATVPGIEIQEAIRQAPGNSRQA